MSNNFVTLMLKSNIYNVDIVHELYLHINIQHFASLVLNIIVQTLYFMDKY